MYTYIEQAIGDIRFSTTPSIIKCSVTMNCDITIYLSYLILCRCRMEEERTGLDLTRGQVQEDLAEVVRNLGLVETALEETQVKVSV